MQENKVNLDNLYSQYSDEELYNLAAEYDDSCEEEKALPIFAALASKGNSKAQHMLGFYYDHGYGGLEENIDEAQKWYEKSALQGNGEAMNSLGDLYIEDTHLYDEEKAIYWYKKAIECGYYEGYLGLGDCYKYGTGVEQNFQQAYDLYMEALEIVNDEDCGFVYYTIGKLFYEIEQYDDALPYLLKVDGIYDGFFDLHLIIGKCYFHGLGTDINYPEAVRHFNESCKYCIPEAYRYLGTCYLNGYGVPKDEKYANECFEKAEKWEVRDNE